MQMCFYELYVKALNWELNWGILSTCSNPFLSAPEELHGLTDGLVANSLRFEADKPFKTMTNILLQFCQREGKEMK